MGSTLTDTKKIRSGSKPKGNHLGNSTCVSQPAIWGKKFC